eukprot:TRINITY_DN876_c0_g2_i14.p1 TRINITY_DN876_c0_g2~~TRINITY_DN876_c0_g2_i14.p1  ORF type:complete len:319 (+),score=99.15 TRINITY_DN876_c0_g2_i14:1229-2185(+)
MTLSPVDGEIYGTLKLPAAPAPVPVSASPRGAVSRPPPPGPAPKPPPPGPAPKPPPPGPVPKPPLQGTAPRPPPQGPAPKPPPQETALKPSPQVTVPKPPQQGAASTPPSSQGTTSPPQDGNGGDGGGDGGGGTKRIVETKFPLHPSVETKETSMEPIVPVWKQKLIEKKGNEGYTQKTAQKTEILEEKVDDKLATWQKKRLLTSTNNCEQLTPPPLSPPPLSSPERPPHSLPSLAGPSILPLSPDPLEELNLSSNVFFSYSQLKSGGEGFPPGIDVSTREKYLSDEEFVEVFHLTKAEFSKLPVWRQLKLKKSLSLY